MVQPDLTADLAFAHELADVAASVTLSWFGDRLPVALKDDATPVTEVDRMTEEAILQIQRYAPHRRTIPLFLGIHPTSVWSVHTNAVLVLTGKGHRWPISYVLSDEINPQLEQKIIAADVRLEEGETVFIRTDEARLGRLEAAIVAKIRASALLCPLTPPGRLVSAYRTTFLRRCDQAA